MIHDFSQDNWLFYVLKGHLKKIAFLDVLKKYNRSHYDLFVYMSCETENLYGYIELCDDGEFFWEVPQNHPLAEKFTKFEYVEY